MFTAKQFRAKAAESAESLKHTDVPSEMRELQRSRQSFSALAENEDWPDAIGNATPTRLYFVGA
jgi:hypothetical protein